MFGPRVTLFRLFGFAIRVDASWLIIAALITWSLAVGFFPPSFPGLAAGTYWWMGAMGALGLFGSIVVHELFHSLVARAYGLPMNGITLFVFGGVAEMEEEPASPGVEFRMAIAGPIASILIGVVLYLVYRSVRGIWQTPVVGVIAYLYGINWILAAFNLVPAFPLDGGRVLRSALWHHWKGNLRRATRVASNIGSGFGVALIVLAVWQLFRGNFVGAIWWFLIGTFLRQASEASYRQLVLRTVLGSQPVVHFMKTNPVTVRPDTSLQELVDQYVYRYHHKLYPVVTGSARLVGCITMDEIRAIPRDQWRLRTAIDVMHPCSPQNTVSPKAEAIQALAIMRKTGRSRLMVADADELVGVVTLKDMLGFLSLKLELEGEPPQITRTAGS